MYSIEFSETAKKQLLKLPSDIQIRILQSLERIKIRPFHFIKRKQGTPHYIFRIGEYRAILDVKKDKLIIFVLETGHRKKIYRR